MGKKMLAIELNSPISFDDFTYLRNLYLPIIGHDSVNLYCILIDYNKISKNSNIFFDLNEISQSNQTTRNETLFLLKKLEAVGLIKNFEKADNIYHIISILKPLKPQKFKNNSLLYRELVSKVDEIVIERIMFFDIQKQFDKSEYKDISTKYQDIFDITPITSTQNNNTLEIPMTDSISRDEAIYNLGYAQFIHYITGEKIKPSQLSELQRLFNSGFSNVSLNLLSNYSYEINGKIVLAHIKTIAKDLIKKEILDAQSISKELYSALENKKIQTKNVSDDFPNNINQNFDKYEDKSKDWDDIFNQLGGEL